MTVSALNALVETAVATALRKVKATRTPGGIPLKLKEHFRKAAQHEETLAKNHKLLADAHGLLAQACASHMDVAGQKCHKIVSDVNAAIARAHDQHAEQLSTLANGGPDVWGLAAETVDSEGRPINDKVARGDDFFSKFIYGGRTPEEMLAPPRYDTLLK